MADTMEKEANTANSREEGELDPPEELPSSQNSLFSLSSLSPKAVLSQRIVNMEYYMCPPVREFDNVYSDFRNSSVKRVPVIRIFGSTPGGQKMCANVHGVYPYVSVLDDENVEGLDYRIASALDSAINESVASNKFQKDNGRYVPPTQHVFKVIRVVGKTFYGFRSEPELFLRIFFYNPLILKKAVDLLQSGAILGRRFQPYEAHIPYNLQFMIDYNLYGMNFVHYAAVKFRRNDRPLAKDQWDQSFKISSQGSNSSSNMAYIDPENIEESLLGPAQLVKQTLCELEIDVIASDIVLGTVGSSKAKSENPGIDSIWKDEMERRRLHGVEEYSQISIPESQARKRAELVHKTEDKFQQILWSKVGNFFGGGESMMEVSSPSSERMSRSLSSSMLDGDHYPSSQVVDHHSQEKNLEKEEAIENFPEEEDYLQMLEEMAKEYNFEQEQEHSFEELAPGQDDNVLDQAQEEIGTEAGEEEEEDAWNDTLLSQSILQKITEAEAAYEDQQKELELQQGQNGKPEENGESFHIFQCDGQGNDSDVGSEASSASAKRKSARLRKESPEKVDPIPKRKNVASKKAIPEQSLPEIDTMNTRSQRNRSEPNSPAVNTIPKPKFGTGRLSLTYRRLSRSQEQMKKEEAAKKINASTSSEPITVEDRTEPVPIPVLPTRSKSRKPSVSTSTGSRERSPADGGSASPPRQNIVTPEKNQRKPRRECDLVRMTGKSPILRLAKLESLSSPAKVAMGPGPKRERKVPKKFLYQDFEVKLPQFSPSSSQDSNTSQQASPGKTEKNPVEAEEMEEDNVKVDPKKTDDKAKTKGSTRPTLKIKKTPKGPGNMTSTPGTPGNSTTENKRLRLRPKGAVVYRGLGRKKRQAKPTQNTETESKDLAKEESEPEPEPDPAPKPEETKTKKVVKQPKVMLKRSDLKSPLGTGAGSKGLNKSDDPPKLDEASPSKHIQGCSDKVTMYESKSTSNTFSSPPSSPIPKMKDVSVNLTRSRSFIERLTHEMKEEIKAKASPVSRKSKTVAAAVPGRSPPSLKITRRRRSLMDQGKNQRNEEELDIKPNVKEVANEKEKAVPSKTLGEAQGQNQNKRRLGSSSRASFGLPIKRSRGTRNSKSKEVVKTEAATVTVAAVVKAKDLESKRPDKVQDSGEKLDESTFGSEQDSNVFEPGQPEPFKVKTFQDEGSNTDIKTYADVGLNVGPTVYPQYAQTDEKQKKNASVQVKADLTSKTTQVPIKTFATISTQTDVEVSSMEVQTDSVVSQCLCQCKCVVKPKQDAEIEVQEDLKPEVRHQRIQVDNVDMITHARSSRFTTPQSNRIKGGLKTTPSRSPEKRRISRDTPVRRPRNIMTPCQSSRYLQALSKTPASASGSLNRFRGIGLQSPQTQTPPTPSSRDMEEEDDSKSKLTPPSRESRELFLVKVISSPSPTSKKRCHHHHHSHHQHHHHNQNVKQENLEGEEESNGIPCPSENEENLSNENVTPNQSASDPVVKVKTEPIEVVDLDTLIQAAAVVNDIVDRTSDDFVDLSVNSIYEYEDDPDSILVKEQEPLGLQDPQPEPDTESIVAATHVKSPLDLPLPGIPSQEPSKSIEGPSKAPVPGVAVTLSCSPNMSIFKQKRIISQQRTKYRIEKKKRANLEANRGIPDIFSFEMEPLKQPPSYKSLAKWLEGVKSTPGELKKFRDKLHHSEVDLELLRKEDRWLREDISSDEEDGPKNVRLFTGGSGNTSDGDSADSDSDSNSQASKEDGLDQGEDAPVKAFTPPNIRTVEVEGYDELPLPLSQYGSQSQGSRNGTPNSILRGRGGSKSGTPSSRRLSGLFLKRKIRWEDVEDGEDSEDLSSQPSSKKRLKFDFENEAEGQGSQDSLTKSADVSELDGPSLKNALGLDNSMSNLQDCKALHSSQYLTTMCVELHCSSRDGLTPDPKVDPILGIFILMSSDYPEGFRRPRESFNMLILEKDNDKALHEFEVHEKRQKVKRFTDEVQMLEAFIEMVRDWDPDIFVGYEVEKSSFGYLIQRGFLLGKDMAVELSRILPPPKSQGGHVSAWRLKEEWNGMISGRIVLNLWRLLRHEISVQSYTFENAAYHILRRRVHKFSYKTLDSYWTQKEVRHKVIQYYTIRIKGAIQIMEKLDLINRTSELARLFGIQFYEVLSRGSQYRVESMMLRATKPQDFIAPSPGVMQRAKMRAPEYLPLIMEPRSDFYTDPVAVLDFQSLYPSMMIAYNYDYASVLGRVEHLGTSDPFPFGCLDMNITPGELLNLKEHIHISPAGVAFLDKSMVRGVLPEMLEQILETRQMVKRSMKRWKNDGASLHKVLDSRQLGLKLIANVTYGYTSANFSGRMPCVEIADSIVSKGRETLQRAIDFVKDNYDRWGGDVVYGDTDSMFILFKGRSKEEAFKLAYEIAEEVTQMNPKPVKLKFEKIYQPCILQSKKRYVGFAYETKDQVKPTYDAKGIETVRRDGCPAVRKILERALHILFNMGKAKVEEYVKLQFEKLFKGRVSMQDYIFAREFRGRAGYKPGACVPSLEIAKRLTLKDPRAEPLVSERVQYVVTYGPSSLPLIKLVRTPEEYLDDPTLRLNAHYYIEKVIIPALNRCLLLAKLDATKWFLQLPRKYLKSVGQNQKKGKSGQSTLDHFVLHLDCMRCGKKTNGDRGLCPKCLEDSRGSSLYLLEILRNSRSKLEDCQEICRNCSGEIALSTGSKCVSIDCPVLHKLTRYTRDQAYMSNVEKELNSLEYMEW